MSDLLDPKVFTLTPAEAGMWQAAVNGQGALVSYIFDTPTFKTAAWLFFSIYLIKGLKAYADSFNVEHLEKIFVKFLCLVAGLWILMTVNSKPFSVVSDSGRSWTGTIERPISSNGLMFYSIAHKATTELSKMATKVVGLVFGDGSYLRSPDMVYKIFTSMAAVTLDDPGVSAKLDALASECGDTRLGKMLTGTSSMAELFDLEKPDCRQKYDALQIDLKAWVEEKMPNYFNILQSEQQYPTFLNRFRDAETVENKIIASAIIDYGKSKNERDIQHLNVGALNLDTSDYFWISFQKMFSTEGMLNLVNIIGQSDRNIDASLSRNHSALAYNRLLNLIPWFRGALKAVLAITFIIMAAMLTFGFVWPLRAWVTALFMEAAYGPVSALAYHFTGLFLRYSEVFERFDTLKNTPLVLVAAHEIDQSVAYLQTIYFILQMVVIFVFGFGILKAGWAVRESKAGPLNFSLLSLVGKAKSLITRI